MEKDASKRIGGYSGSVGFSPTEPGNRGAPLARRETEVYWAYGER